MKLIFNIALIYILAQAVVSTLILLVTYYIYRDINNLLGLIINAGIVVLAMYNLIQVNYFLDDIKWR